MLYCRRWSTVWTSSPVFHFLSSLEMLKPVPSRPHSVWIEPVFHVFCDTSLDVTLSRVWDVKSNRAWLHQWWCDIGSTARLEPTVRLHFTLCCTVFTRHVQSNSWAVFEIDTVDRVSIFIATSTSVNVRERLLVESWSYIFLNSQLCRLLDWVCVPRSNIRL